VNLNLTYNIEGYVSSSQIARVLTESWVKANIYCPSCGTNELGQFNNNRPVADFFCLSCEAEYELKSKKGSFALRVVDGAYKTMIQRINSNNNPHFFFLNYSISNLNVSNFLVIPKHFFIDDMIEKRTALNVNTRRAGWVGCNILLHQVPLSGRIFLVKDGELQNKNAVLQTWAKTSFLAEQKKESRGWLIETMKVMDMIPTKDFSLSDVYKHEDHLKAIFPNNNFIKDKLRQQLQVLRDKEIIEFKGKGQYRKII